MNSFLQVLRRGMTYDGRIAHVLINYALIILVLLPNVFIGQRMEGSPDWTWMTCLGIALLVQVLLWFIAQASGVSIVWSALAGYTLIAYGTRGTGSAEQNGFLALLALSSAGCAIVYYAVTYPLITTIAHICAVLLGIGVWFGLR